MSNTARIHLHQCPKCKNETQCADYQCYRRNFAYARLCHGTSCSQDSTLRQPKEKPPAEPDLFDEPETRE